MAERNEKYRANYIEALQPFVSEPIREVGGFSRPDSVAGIGVHKLSPLAAAAVRHDGKGAAGGLPKSVVMAVTDSTVHVFDFKTRGSSIKVKEEVARWSREGLVCSAERGTLATRLMFDFPDGGRVEVDSNVHASFNVAAIELLTGAQPS